MDPGRVGRLMAWLARSELLGQPPERIRALARALEGPDPPVTVGRWGSIVVYEPGPGRRRLAELDRGDNLIAALRWQDDGRLAWAKCLTAGDAWVGIEPRAGEHPGWGGSDRIWELDGARAWAPRGALTVFQSVDYERPDFIPPLAEPGRLPPGAGTAILNLLAGLMKDHGVIRARYRGPYPTEQLFTSLLESFRYDPAAGDPLGAFMDSGALDWLPAPHERHRVRPGLTVQLRHEVDKVVLEGAAFYRADWQGVIRREPRVVRRDGDRVICSLWALGQPLEDRLVLDRAGVVREAPEARTDAGAPAPLEPLWRPALAELIARESAPPLAESIRRVTAGLALEWGPVPGDLLAADGTRVRLSRRFRDAGRDWIREAPAGAPRGERAIAFALEAARLLGPLVRGLAQSHLAALPAAAQRRALEEGSEAPGQLSESVGRLLALIVRQSA